MIYNNVRFGADPEVLLMKKKAPGENVMVSAVGHFPGTKQKPHPLDSEGSAVQVDNVALEFNIAPASTKEEFVSNVCSTYHIVKAMALKKGFDFWLRDSAHYAPSELATKEASEFGCEPDFCVYTQSQNQIDKSKVPETLRSAGGHLHVSWDMPEDEDDQIEQQTKLVKYLDYFVGPWVCLLDIAEYRSERRALYGKAGCFRFKPYGIEYRSPGNAWIHTPERVGEMFMRAKRAVNALNKGIHIPTQTFNAVRRAMDLNIYERLRDYNKSGNAFAQQYALDE